jgi:2-polyprenyl-3-methyl-5-hydroxy-6-metoxy-1,4-benzoquinol methylase
LDFGCGGAVLSYNLARKGADTVALDLYIDLKVVKSVMDRLMLNEMHFAKGDGACLPFSSGSFDAVFALDVLEHVRDLQQSIGEIHRILNNEGVLVVSVPFEGNIYYRIASAFAKERGERHTTVTLRQRMKAPHLNTLSDITIALQQRFCLEKKSTIPLFPKMFLVASFCKLQRNRVKQLPNEQR